jgi:hypothetical protein
MRSRLCGSTPTVGSSSSTTLGSWSTPHAMLSRRFMPPENRLIGSAARSDSPVQSSAQRTRSFSVAPANAVQSTERLEILARREQR